MNGALWLLPLAGFLVGSVPFGLLIAQSRGLDIRKHGSGNIGATNVWRTLGKKAGMLCLLLDFLKGFLPTLVALSLCRLEGREGALGLAVLSPWATVFPASQQFLAQLLPVLTALGGILGHNYSPWVGFRGGKGIATSAGALSALMPFGVVLLVGVFGVMLLVTRYVSVASMAAAVALPLLTHWGARVHHVGGDPEAPTLWEAGTWNRPLFLFALVAGVLAVWRHRTNLGRLLAGTEPRLGQGKARDQGVGSEGAEREEEAVGEV